MNSVAASLMASIAPSPSGGLTPWAFPTAVAGWRWLPVRLHGCKENELYIIYIFFIFKFKYYIYKCNVIINATYSMCSALIVFSIQLCKGTCSEDFNGGTSVVLIVTWSMVLSCLSKGGSRCDAGCKSTTSQSKLVERQRNMIIKKNEWIGLGSE